MGDEVYARFFQRYPSVGLLQWCSTNRTESTICSRSRPISRREDSFQIFNGNFDKALERIHYLNLPFTARFVRFIPKEWNNRLSMRAGLLGCPHKGSLALSLLSIDRLLRFQVLAVSATFESKRKLLVVRLWLLSSSRSREVFLSVENLAYRKRISLNDLTASLPYSPSFTFLSYLIDGYDVPSRCATIDSTRCRNNEPQLLLDLHRSYFIQGVIIQQLDTCKRESLPFLPSSSVF